MGSRNDLPTGPPQAPANDIEPDKVVTVLAINQVEADHLVLQGIFNHSNWQISFVRSWREAQALLIEHRVPVILCEREVRDATWKDVLGEITRLPDTPVLIVTSPADATLWGEVLNLGAYDLLAKPFDASEVFRVVSLAWLNWKNRLGHRQTFAA